MRPKLESKIMWGLAVLSIFMLFKTSDEPLLSCFKDSILGLLFQKFPAGNTIIFGLSAGYIVSVIFYIIVVWIPENRRKRIVKNNLKIQYKHFKEDVLSILLSACCDGGYEASLTTELLDMVKFRDYFKESVSESQNRWHAVQNGLNALLLKDLLVIFDIFKDEVSFVLNNVAIDDENIFSFFKRLSHSVYRLKNSSSDYDDLNYLAGFLWEVFAGWSFIEGYREEDIIDMMIKKI